MQRYGRIPSRDVVALTLSSLRRFSLNWNYFANIIIIIIPALHGFGPPQGALALRSTRSMDL